MIILCPRFCEFCVPFPKLLRNYHRTHRSKPKDTDQIGLSRHPRFNFTVSLKIRRKLLTTRYRSPENPQPPRLIPESCPDHPPYLRHAGPTRPRPYSRCPRNLPRSRPFLARPLTTMANSGSKAYPPYLAVHLSGVVRFDSYLPPFLQILRTQATCPYHMSTNSQVAD